MSLFRIEFSADLERAAWAASAIRGVAALWVDEDMQLYQLELAVAEALNNAAQYSQGHIVVMVDKVEDSISIEVQSHGDPIAVDLDRINDPRNFDPDDIQALAESGRGFFLIQELTSDLSLEHDNGVNTIKFKIPLNPGP